MRFIKLAMAVLSLSFVAATAGASPASPVTNIDFRTLDKTQPVDSGNKVEVIEFFWYSCPHCNVFDPDLAEWVKAQGDNIAFKRVPVAFRPGDAPQQKLYYALEAMGKVEELHRKIFHAIHVDHKPLNDEGAIADFVASQGVDRAKFLSAYNSFGVQTKAQRATQLTQLYKVDGVPLIAIGGRYETSPSIIGDQLGYKPEQELHAATLKVMNWLVVKEAKEHKPQAAAPAKVDKASSPANK
ncbi:MAG: thiol:disulfide interchange protein DsbA/DsbL [Burkholderiales bacterium]